MSSEQENVNLTKYFIWFVCKHLVTKNLFIFYYIRSVQILKVSLIKLPTFQGQRVRWRQHCSGRHFEPCPQVWPPSEHSQQSWLAARDPRSHWLDGGTPGQDQTHTCWSQALPAASTSALTDNNKAAKNKSKFTTYETILRNLSIITSGYCI